MINYREFLLNPKFSVECTCNYTDTFDYSSDLQFCYNARIATFVTFDELELKFKSPSPAPMLYSARSPESVPHKNGDHQRNTLSTCQCSGVLLAYY